MPEKTMEEILRKAILRHMEKKNKVIDDNQHGFSRIRSCLTNLVAFYGGFTARATEIICIDFYRVFDTIPHDILVAKLEKH